MIHGWERRFSGKRTALSCDDVDVTNQRTHYDGPCAHDSEHAMLLSPDNIRCIRGMGWLHLWRWRTLEHGTHDGDDWQ